MTTTNARSLTQSSKGIRIFLAVLFALFSYTQFNDPDPLLWISIYGSISVLMIISIYRKVPVFVLGIIAGILIVYAAILIPEIVSWINKGMPSIVESMKAEQPHIEYTREFFGIIICLFALLYLWRSK